MYALWGIAARVQSPHLATQSLKRSNQHLHHHEVFHLGRMTTIITKRMNAYSIPAEAVSIDDSAPLAARFGELIRNPFGRQPVSCELATRLKATIRSD